MYHIINKPWVDSVIIFIILMQILVMSLVYDDMPKS